MNITLAQLNYQIGDFEGNYNKIINAIHNHKHHSDMIVFSELNLCGYYPHDLLTRSNFLEQHDFYLHKIIAETKTLTCSIVLGIITRNTGKGKPLYNSLIVVYQGEIIHTYHKKLLPTYNIFNEARHFEPGPITSGNELFSFKNHLIGFLICEDGWAKHPNLDYPSNPASFFEKNTVDFIIVINASPSNINKQQDRIAIFKQIALKANAPVLFCNQVGGNDDIVFDGASFILNHQGNPIANLPYFKTANGQVFIDKNNTNITYSSFFEDFHYLDNLELIYQQILLGLIDYAKKCRFKGVVIGLSGGMDSAITLTLATLALGKENVKAIFMPTRYTALQSQTDSELLCKNLEVELFHLNIDNEFEFSLKQFEQTFKQKPNKLTKQNIQARIRGRILMEYSNQTGLLVLSTGNKSELSCGYTTLYGDMTGGLNLIGDLYKTDVYHLAEYINKNQLLKNLIPETIIQRAPTAELDFDQKDSDDLLPYPQLDAILKLYIEGDLLDPSEKKSLENFISSIPLEVILKIHRMVDKAEFKRKQSAPIIRVQKRSFGDGRRIPISMFIR